MDNTQFTEEQKAEAWRQLHAGHLDRQTAALESIRNYVFYLLLIVLLGVVVGGIMAISAEMQ